MENVCRSKDNAKRPPPPIKPVQRDTENAIFDSLCNVESSTASAPDDNCTELKSFQRQPQAVAFTESCPRRLPIDHHIYDNLSKTWTRCASRPQPIINVHARLISEDYTSLGFDSAPNAKSAIIPAIADTGCQSCLAGVKVINRLGLYEADLIPVTMHMHTICHNGIRILGAVLLRLACRTKTDQMVETRQMTYVTDGCDKLFLSREACQALGLIKDTFPSPSITQSNESTAAAATTEPAPCHCPFVMLLAFVALTLLCMLSSF